MQHRWEHHQPLGLESCDVIVARIWKVIQMFDLLKLSTAMANNCLPFMVAGVAPLHPLDIFNLASFRTSLACSPPFCRVSHLSN